jgi:hypothetical protein
VSPSPALFLPGSHVKASQLPLKRCESPPAEGTSGQEREATGYFKAFAVGPPE